MVLAVGIDVGSVSINCIVIDEHLEIIWEAPYVRHFGQVAVELGDLLKELYTRFDQQQIRSISFTGMHGERLSDYLDAPYEVETIAQVLGAIRIMPGVKTIISMGGQDTALFQLAHHGDQWQLEAFNMNGPCAAGTGSFIDQQAERLASSMYAEQVTMDQKRLQQVLDDFIDLGTKHSSPAAVACRCTVFTKSDMIHLQNKGEPLPNIIAGLHRGNAANYVSTLVGNRTVAKPVIFVGGMASNRLQVDAFKEYYPELRVPSHHTSLGALGVAIQAQRQKWRNRIDPDKLQPRSSSKKDDFPRSEPLRLQLTRFDPDNSLPPWPGDRQGPIRCYLGVDVGSTTTKYALIDEQARIVHKCYLQTQGKPIEVTQKLLKTLKEKTEGRIEVRGVATTGSGRNVVGDFLAADLIIDEITAHALGAVAVDSNVDTIFEIGGQDSKYIRIEDRHPLDFDMNKVCAAGTGSFLHELANKMKINIMGEFEEIALSSQQPLHLAERCTVFMESDLVSYAQKGAERHDLIAGLCYAIVHNYLNRVVGKRSIGERVMFLGGPSLNRGIVAAFEKVLGKPLVVPRHREVLGGYGAALAVMEDLRAGELDARERDLDALIEARPVFSEQICRANSRCFNECKLKVYDFCGRKSVWGGECGRYDRVRRKGREALDLFAERNEMYLQALGRPAVSCDHPLCLAETREKTGPTVGIPIALHTLEWGVFWAHLLAESGFRVVFSPWTNERIVRSGVECMSAETCFPVKVFHGHVRYLMDDVDYLFLPNVIDMPTPGENESGLFCPLMEGSQYLVRAALNLSEKRLICPTLYLKQGPEDLVSSLQAAFPKSLRPETNVLRRAVVDAWARQKNFRVRLLQRGRSFLAGWDGRTPLWIVTGRGYNLFDERMNLRLGRHLARLGIQAVPMEFVDLDPVDLGDFPRMYWGLGARILRAAKKIARTPNWFGVHVTNFSCGADSFIEHFYKQILGSKPSLVLELDEHSAVAGILTRVEAFHNVVGNVRKKHSAEDHRPGIEQVAASR